jgi:hypothetical protein
MGEYFFLGNPDEKTTWVLVFKHLCNPETKANMNIHQALLKVIEAAHLLKITENRCYLGGIDEWKGKTGMILRNCYRMPGGFITDITVWTLCCWLFPWLFGLHQSNSCF